MTWGRGRGVNLHLPRVRRRLEGDGGDHGYDQKNDLGQRGQVQTGKKRGQRCDRGRDWVASN
jgi:hypothetical protein